MRRSVQQCSYVFRLLCDNLFLSRNFACALYAARMEEDTELSHPSDGIAASAARLRAMARKARNPASKRAYDADIAHYERWCATQNLRACPASVDTLIYYFECLSSGNAARAPGAAPLVKGRWQVATIARRRASLSKYHGLQGVHPNPAKDTRVLQVIKDIKRTVGVAQKRKDPLLPDAIEPTATQMATETDPRAMRDLAIVLLGFLGALRRQELADLDHEHLVFDAGGVWLTLPWRKTDQEGRGTVVGVPRGVGAMCPVRALSAWIARLARGTGPVFVGMSQSGAMRGRISTGEIARVVRRFAARAGLDPSNFAGHSLRRGLVTAMVRAGRDAATIMRQTGHKSEQMIRLYTAEDKDWSRNPVRGLL